MIISFKVLEIQYSPDLKSRWGLVFLLNILYVQDVTVLTPKKINNIYFCSTLSLQQPAMEYGLYGRMWSRVRGVKDSSVGALNVLGQIISSLIQ